MTPLLIHYTTFNCARQTIDQEFFASSLCTTLNSSLPPDFIVLALQEVAPIANSFLGGTLLEPYFTCIQDATELATRWTFAKSLPEVRYEHLLTKNAGMTGIVVFVREDVKEKINWTQQAMTGVGLWEMGNKGAVGVRLALESKESADVEDTLVTFIAAHLAPMEEGWERRNEDWKSICQTLVFEPAGAEWLSSAEQQPLLSKSSPTSASSSLDGIFNPASYVFFAGDLNYRTSDTSPSPGDFESWPQPMSPNDNDLTALLSKDQLTRERKANKTLHHLTEAAINYPATYKYSSRAQKLAKDTARAHASALANHDESSTSGIKFDDIKEQVWLWSKHRFPSWCDRILYLTVATVHTYTALPVQPTSDHRPVVLSCEIPWRPLDEDQIVRRPRYEVSSDYRVRRDWARKLEIMVGIGAYATTTGQGPALLVAVLATIFGGYLILNHLVG